MQSTIASLIAALIPFSLILFIENRGSAELIAIYVTALSLVNPINQLFNVDIKRLHILSNDTFKENFNMRLAGGITAFVCIGLVSLFLFDQSELMIFCFILIIVRYFDSIADLLAADFILKEQNHKQIINRLCVLLLFFISMSLVYFEMYSIYIGLSVFIIFLLLMYGGVILKNFDLSAKSFSKLSSNLALGTDSLLTSLTFYLPIYFLTGSGNTTLMAQFGLLQTLAVPLRLVLSSYLYQYLTQAIQKKYKDFINKVFIVLVPLFFILSTFILHGLFEVMFQNTSNTSFLTKFLLVLWVTVNSMLFIEISYLVKNQQKKLILLTKIANILFIIISFFSIGFIFKTLSIELMQSIIIFSEAAALIVLRLKR